MCWIRAARFSIRLMLFGAKVAQRTPSKISKESRIPRSSIDNSLFKNAVSVRLQSGEGVTGPYRSYNVNHALANVTALKGEGNANLVTFHQQRKPFRNHVIINKQAAGFVAMRKA